MSQVRNENRSQILIHISFAIYSIIALVLFCLGLKLVLTFGILASLVSLPFFKNAFKAVDRLFAIALMVSISDRSRQDAVKVANANLLMTSHHQVITTPLTSLIQEILTGRFKGKVVP